MDKAAEIKRIWRERFSDTRQWMTDVYPRIYRDDEALVRVDNEAVVSSLLLRRYEMTYQGLTLPVGYIYGAATTKSMESRGHMSDLMRQALNEARRRGDAIVALQPARRRLYSFYARFGFITAFFIDEQRFTARHLFAYDDSDIIVEETVCDYDELAAAYLRLSVARPSTMVHSGDDLKTIVIDNMLDRGLIAVARSVSTGQIIGIGFCNVTTQTIAVRDLLAADENAANAVLASFVRRRPNRMMVVESYPERPGINFASRAMARIVNVAAVIQAFVTINQDLQMTFHITDPIIEENNGWYRAAGGRVERIDEPADRHADLDVSVDVLTKIMFSSKRMGEIFSLPTCRPFMSLMLS